MKRTLQMLVLIAVAAVLLSPSVVSGQFFFMKNENIGKEVKDFTLGMLNGDQTSLTEFREGTKTIVFFWATWCPHCRTALNDLNKTRGQIEDLGIRIALVDVGESAEIVGQYFRQNNIQMDVFLDQKSDVAEAYGVVGVPSFYFVGEDGIVRDVQHSLPEDLESAFYGS